jgi:type 2 lantibiotic biosynthesis protein LanM
MLSPAERRAIAWAASSIYERAARARRAAPPIDSRARPVLSTWNQAFAPGDPDAFTRRLSWDDLDAELIAGALDDAGEGDPARWTEWLLRVEDAALGVARDLAAGELPELRDAPSTGGPPFVELWIALMRAGRSSLGSRPSALSDHALASIERQLLRELAVYGELAAHELFRATSDYSGFVSATLNDGLSTLWKSFPVLARQLAVVVDAWVTTTRELIDRIEADRAALDAFFGAGQPLGEVADVTPGLSDPHDGRHRVAILHFTSGTRILYKPRDLTIDHAFAGLACWFAERGLNPAVPSVRVLPRRGYGWCEYVEREDFPDRTAVARYYEHAGVLIFIAHMLGARDLHMENVIARRAGPTLIDLELLLQPVAQAREQPPTHRVEDDAGAESCLRTGLLSLFEIGPGEELFDLGGLRGTGATPAVTATRQWTGLRTDGIAFVDEPARPAPVNNTVVVEGLAHPPEEFPDDVAAGFEAAYRVALAHRDELMAPTGPISTFADAEVRVLVRPTNQYGVLSAIRNVPRYQRDGVAHGIVVDALHRPLKASRERPREWPVVVEERRVAEALDVPRFVVPGDGRTLYSNGRPILHDYYALSPVEAVRDRIFRLSEEDCHVQRRILRRAVAQSTATRLVTAYPHRPVHKDPAYDADEELVAHALWVADELLAHATRDSAGLIWETPHLDRVEAHALYDGAVGPGLFFAALASVSGEARWRDAARAALAPTIERIEAADFFDRAARCTIGGCSGLGSIVHALARAGALLQDDRLISAADRVAAAIDSSSIARNRYFDVVDGAAGALLALLTLHDVRANDALVARAIECGDHLLDSHIESADGWAWPSPSGRHLAGFAHGSAGIATALARLSAVTGLPPYRDAALRAFEFVSGLFESTDCNWPVSRPDPNNVMTIMAKMNAWCHGAPGIAVAAFSAPADGSQPAIVDQARRALETIERWSPSQADHLCCGHLGRADAMLTAGIMLGSDAVQDRARDIAARVLLRARSRQHFRLSTPGVEYLVFAPGFYRGLSGIGYQLLRLAAPERVPSILFFGQQTMLEQRHS